MSAPRSLLPLFGFALAVGCDYPVGADVTFELASSVAPPSAERKMVLVVDYEERLGTDPSDFVSWKHAKVVCDVEDLWFRYGGNGCPPEVALEARLYVAGDEMGCGDILLSDDAPTGEPVASSDRVVLWEGEGATESTYRCPDVDVALELTLTLHPVSAVE